MSQSARPTSLTSATWTGAYTDLADESDATYVQSPDGPVASQTFLCALSSIIDPGVDTGHQIRVRAVLEPSTGSPLDLVLAVENADDSSVVAIRTYVAPGAYVDGVVTLTTAEAARIHSYAGLQVRGYGQEAGSGSIAFVWAAVGGATSYVLQIGSATTLSDIFNFNVGNVTDYSVTLSAGTYYSRVVPVGAGSETDEQTTVVS